MERDFRGKSVVALPSDYVVVDTETTGLDFEYCDLIEISAIRYENDAEVARFSSLVKPDLLIHFTEDGRVEEYVDSFITELTGITNDMLETAPEPEEVLPAFLSFIGDSILVGHNIPFDITFLYDASMETCNTAVSNDYINTLRIAHKALPGLAHYRLSDVAVACGVSQPEAHRGIADCETTAKCYQAMKSTILAQMTEAEFQQKFKTHHGSYADFIANMDLSQVDADDSSLLYGKTVVFTGTLEKMCRKDALTLVAQLGGIPADSVTKATNYLVIGNGEFVKSVKEGKTSKMKKAEAMALKGADIKIISENAFWDIVSL